MKRKDSWLEPIVARQRGALMDGAWCLYPMGRTLLKRNAVKYCEPHGSLTPDHAMRLHSRLTDMAKDLPGSRVEFGMVRGAGWVADVRWVYAAIGVFDGGKLTAGSVIIPGVACVPYFVRNTLTNPTQYHRALRLWDDLFPVVEPVQGTGTVARGREVAARRDQVRPGDAYLYDLTECYSPRVIIEGIRFGRACAFGALDEMIDAARVRMVFGSLASA
jgi:hypothetical protein